MTITRSARAVAPVLDGQGSVYALLTDGSTVEIRSAQPEDAEAVRAMHAAMSPDNLYLRFFSLSPYSGEREAERVCLPPGADHGALLAWLAGRLVGVASYEPVGAAGSAEVAFAVPDQHAPPRHRHAAARAPGVAGPAARAHRVHRDDAARQRRDAGGVRQRRTAGPPLPRRR